MLIGLSKCQAQFLQERKTGVVKPDFGAAVRLEQPDWQPFCRTISQSVSMWMRHNVSVAPQWPTVTPVSEPLDCHVGATLITDLIKNGKSTKILYFSAVTSKMLKFTSTHFGCSVVTFRATTDNYHICGLSATFKCRLQLITLDVVEWESASTEKWEISPIYSLWILIGCLFRNY